MTFEEDLEFGNLLSVAEFDVNIVDVRLEAKVVEKTLDARKTWPLRVESGQPGVNCNRDG